MPATRDDDADDEVLDLAVAPAGSHILVWLSEDDPPPVKGQVARTDESGGSMLVTIEDGTERWVASDDRWTLAELLPDNDLSVREEALVGAIGGSDAVQDDTPIIRNYEWNGDGTLSGNVYGKPGFRDGEAITTSAVDPAQRHATYIITESGSAYILGEARQQADVRRSGRATVKESMLDAFAERGEQPVAGMAGLTWLVGGADAGGAAAEKVMRSAFTVLDDNMINLRSQYAQARRFVLCKEGVPVAAAVAEAHADQATLEVPILAAAKTQRQKGHGSLLVALLIEVAARLRPSPHVGKAFLAAPQRHSATAVTLASWGWHGWP